MTYIEGLTDHRVPNISDPEDVIVRLSPTVLTLMRVGDYLRAENPARTETHPIWRLDEYDKDHFIGPGGFIVRFGSRVAQITALTRYSTFVLTPSLQAVYLPAIRSIARALGGTRLVLKSNE